jgi:SAM-dependent methyltransferase/DNA-binding NarL/FixJ family response regulator
MPNSHRKVVFIDDQPEEESKRLFGQNCVSLSCTYTDINQFGMQVLATGHPDNFVRLFSEGKLRPDAVLLDVDFSKSLLNQLRLVDPKSDSGIGWRKEEWGYGILKTIKRIDPDLPVIMLTVHEEVEYGHLAGWLGAVDYFLKRKIELGISQKAARTEFLSRLDRAIALSKERPLYDHEHLQLVDSFAVNYDREERGKCATMAYYAFENTVIARVLEDLLKECRAAESRLRVLDVGCGTGRVEEFVCKRFQEEDLARIHMVGVDFSGRMLVSARHKLERCNRCTVGFGMDPSDCDARLRVSLYRAPAENLAFLRERYPDGFDVVILGFGLLSYVRYRHILPAAGSGPGSGVVPLLKPGGKLLFSVYNERSAIYERIRLLQGGEDESDLPLAALMNLATGRLRVCERLEVACEAFRVDRVIRLLRQAGLSIDPDEVTTFPTVHLMLRNSAVMSGDNGNDLGFREDPWLPPGKSSKCLIDLDIQVSRALADRGHYIVGLATRPAKR